MVKRRNFMRKILMLISVVFLLSSCITDFNKQRYKGYVYVKNIPENYGLMDIVVLSGDNTMEEVNVPPWFKDIYKIGDTIK